MDDELGRVEHKKEIEEGKKEGKYTWIGIDRGREDGFVCAIDVHEVQQAREAIQIHRGCDVASKFCSQKFLVNLDSQVYTYEQ